MKIRNEQAMISFGENLAKKLPTIETAATPKIAENATTPPTAQVIELVGDVGTGKTTLVRGLARGLGIKTPVTSPSFTISKVYALPSGGNLVHYDFYRLGDPGLMAEDLAENLADPHSIVVVEWAGGVDEILPPNRLKINLQYNDDGTREVTLS